MKTPVLRTLGLATFLGLIQSAVLMAAPFDAEFRIERIAGECHVKPPAASDFVAAEAGKAYSYGTEIKTGEKSSAVLVLSAGNECQVLANARLTLSEDASDKKLKRVKLTEGRVDVALEKDFRKSNEFEIEAPTAVCSVTGSKVSVATRSQTDKKVGAFGCTEGRMNVRGLPYFAVPEMDAGDQMTVACAIDNSYIYLRDSAGTYEVELKGADGSPRRVMMKPNAVIKIHITKAATSDKTVVTTVTEGLEGKPEGESWVYEVGGATGQPTEPIRAEKPKPSSGAVAKEGEELQPSTMPTTTTTTTTVPSPTPVGER